MLTRALAAGLLLGLTLLSPAPASAGPLTRASGSG
jgi:hypothetical protein